MHPPSPKVSPPSPGFAWPLLCGLIAGASTLAWWAGAPASWVWSAHGWEHAPWTLWSAALVHQTLAHGVGNLLALGALAVLGRSGGAGRRDALALALAWPLGTLGLLAWPQVTHYWGLSVVTHAAAALLWVRLSMAPSTRWVGRALMAGLVFKLWWERGWAVPLAFDAGWGFNVTYAAHLSGALAGVGTGALLLWLPVWLHRPAPGQSVP